MDNRRIGNRITTRFESLYSGDQVNGMGTLADISYSGALIESSNAKPEIRIFVFIQPIEPLELTGSVVRHTDSGFAIEYPEVEDELRRMVDDAAAIVCAPARP